MFSYKFKPRFNDTDALGHINNTAFPVWFEQARAPVFELFHPTLGIEDWPLILARIEVNFKAQTYWGKEVEVRTFIAKLGTSSCHVLHEAWQEGKLVADGVAVLIHFDYNKQKACEIPEDTRKKLEEHLKPDAG